MVSPGLQIQGMIEVPGPALVSIVSLTEGVAEGLPRVQVPTTFTIHTSQSFMIPGRIVALPAFPRHMTESEDLLRSMEGLHISGPDLERASGSASTSATTRLPWSPGPISGWGQLASRLSPVGATSG